MATSGNGSYKMEGVRGGLHPAVDINRLNKKKKKNKLTIFFKVIFKICKR